jgi:uncharacterized membrane protein YebE (DUF533 family)
MNIIASILAAHHYQEQAMFDVERLLGQMLNKGVGKSLGGGIAGLGNAVGSVNGGIGAGIGKGALGLGALGVAWAAFEHFSEQSKSNAGATAMPPPMPGAATAMPPPPPTSNDPIAMPPPPPAAAPVADALPVVSDAQREQDATHLIRAMIAAANADGKIDADERSKILERAMTAGISPATQQFLLAELQKPAALSVIVEQTPAHLKIDTYGATLMAIEIDTDAEHSYARQLATGLGLSVEQCQQIRAKLTA